MMPGEVDVGALKLVLKSRHLRPGDVVRGRLAVTRPLEARRLVVGLEATQRMVLTRPSLLGDVLTFRTATVWTTHLELDHERTYQPGASFPFELIIPSAALEPGWVTVPGGVAARGEIEWCAFSLLHRPWTTTLRAKVSLQLTRSPARKRPRPRRPTRPG